MILSTKVGRVLRAPIDPAAEPEGWVGGLKFEAYYDYSYDGIMRSFEDSLQRLGMTQAEFAAAFHLPVTTLRDWEQHRSVPDAPARALLLAIERDPEAMRRLLADRAA